MKLFFFWVLLTLFSPFSYGQMVKFIKNEVSAKYRVFVTKDKREASHFIYRVSNPAEIRKPGDWYIVTNPQLFKQAMTLYEVKRKEDADFVVYYVSTRDSAKITIDSKR